MIEKDFVKAIIQGLRKSTRMALYEKELSKCSNLSEDELNVLKGLLFLLTLLDGEEE